MVAAFADPCRPVSFEPLQHEAKVLGRLLATTRSAYDSYAAVVGARLGRRVPRIGRLRHELPNGERPAEVRGWFRAAGR